MKNPSHPGDILKRRVLPAAGLTVTAAARRLQVTRQALNNLVNARAACRRKWRSASCAPSAARWRCGSGCRWPTTSRNCAKRAFRPRSPRFRPCRRSRADSAGQAPAREGSRSDASPRPATPAMRSRESTLQRQRRMNSPARASALRPSASRAFQSGQAWIMRGQTSSVTATSAAPMAAASRVASASSVSAEPTWISSAGNPKSRRRGARSAGRRGRAAPAHRRRRARRDRPCG
jgi:hypothetical protein